jgi:hypothetical protein
MNAGAPNKNREAFAINTERSMSICPAGRAGADTNATNAGAIRAKEDAIVKSRIRHRSQPFIAQNNRLGDAPIDSANNGPL